MYWPKGGWKNTNNHGSGGGYEIPRQVPSYQGPLFRGGGPNESGPKSGQGPSKKETQKQKIPTKSGVTGSAYLHSMGARLQGVGKELHHHQVEEVPQMIKEMMNQVRRKMRMMILMKKLYQ